MTRGEILREIDHRIVEAEVRSSTLAAEIAALLGASDDPTEMVEWLWRTMDGIEIIECRGNSTCTLRHRIAHRNTGTECTGWAKHIFSPFTEAETSAMSRRSFSIQITSLSSTTGRQCQDSHHAQ